MYSIMQDPMTACGCFECIAMVIPEANGVMVVSREDPSMTPAGMTFSTLAGVAGGGLQTPGVMGVGKYYLLSRKFISADGGFKRIVWMSSILKETMAEELKAVCEREGDPDLLDKIADERSATTVEELLPFLEEQAAPGPDDGPDLLRSVAYLISHMKGDPDVRSDAQRQRDVDRQDPRGDPRRRTRPGRHPGQDRDGRRGDHSALPALRGTDPAQARHCRRGQRSHSR